MDIQRFLLFLVFSFSLLFLWEAWQRDQARPTGVAQPGIETQSPASVGSSAVAPAKAPVEVPAVESKPAGASEAVVVRTDVVEAEISLSGGEVRSLKLLRHGDIDDPRKPFPLLGVGTSTAYVAQSGLLGPGLPTHHAQYRAAERRYELRDGQSELQLVLETDAGAGRKAKKLYTFRRGSYVVDVKQEIDNNSGEPIEAHAYFQLVRDGKPPRGETAMAPTFTGVAVYTDQDKFQKVAFDDIAKGKAKHSLNARDGWIGVVQHYFLGAWIPENGAPREYYTKKIGEDLYSAGFVVAMGSIAPGASAAVSARLYAGPQEQSSLAKIAPGLELSVDYGWLTPIAAPLFWALRFFHGWVENWGVAIVLLTVVIKAVFYPLSAASYRSMAKMRLVAPKLQRIKEQYGDDRQRLHQAMMELYKTEKINPLGGCLPILVQIPVFIALYWVLLASVELRHAPLALWIEDLSVPDPFYILPIVMGLTMIIQTRLNPTPPDPIQARVMQVMPIAFSIFFFFFPAGLVLYWLVNNILSILQQWYITRGLERAKARGHGTS